MKYLIILWIIGVYGWLRSSNFILMFISLELMLLAISLLIVSYSIYYDEVTTLLLSMYIIGIAGAETAIGLAILINYYRLMGSISIHEN
jgi:NADH-ubiquinone oxidoreductase chain 4L